MKLQLFAAAMLLAAPGAGQQTLEVRVLSGGQTFVHRETLSDGAQASFDGAVDSLDESVRRKIIFNAVLTSVPGEGLYELEYQLEIQGGSRHDALQSQSAVRLKPGAALVVAQCSGINVSLTLGKAGQAAAAPGNYRLTAEAWSKDGKDRCFQAVKTGAQSNLVGAMTLGENRKSFIMNCVLADKNKEGAFPVQYQIELAPDFQAQNDIALWPKKKTFVSTGGGAGLALQVDPAR